MTGLWGCISASSRFQRSPGSLHSCQSLCIRWFLVSKETAVSVLLLCFWTTMSCFVSFCFWPAKQPNTNTGNHHWNMLTMWFAQGLDSFARVPSWIWQSVALGNFCAPELSRREVPSLRLVFGNYKSSISWYKMTKNLPEWSWMNCFFFLNSRNTLHRGLETSWNSAWVSRSMVAYWFYILS